MPLVYHSDQAQAQYSFSQVTYFTPTSCSELNMYIRFYKFDIVPLATSVLVWLCADHKGT